MTARLRSRSMPAPLDTSIRRRLLSSTCSVCLCFEGRNSPSISASPAEIALAAAPFSSPPRSQRRNPIGPLPGAGSATRTGRHRSVSHPDGRIGHVRESATNPAPAPRRPQPEQLGFEGMPEKLFVCTPSKLVAYEDCPRRYRFAYLDRPAPPKGPAWAHNSLGASVHTALR